MNIGDNIKRLRKEAGVSQAELADKVGVTQGMLSRIECGTRVPPLMVCVDIAQALKCSIDSLVMGV